MSLFPAHANEAPNTKDIQEDQSWLQNSSFQPCQATSPIPDDLIGKTCRNSSSSDEYSDNRNNDHVSKKRHRLKRQKAKVKKAKHDSPEQNHSDFYNIDLNGHRELLSVDTISRPSAPIYRVAFYLKRSSNMRKHKFKRYHKLVLEKKIEYNEVFTEQSIQGKLLGFFLRKWLIT
nr:unnamed protein product [Callosobruchus analis]